MDSKLSVLIISISIILVFLVPIGPVNAVAPSINLPLSPVTIEVFNGGGSFFDIVLSNVPQGYDVTNKAYRGWCVDRRSLMPLSPATHQVTLFSSFYPPPGFASQTWNMVNYILNHKQGVSTDIQEAIWYFINMMDGYTPPSATAQAMVNDALQNGSYFNPEAGQVVAVICYTTVPELQIAIIEYLLSTGPRLAGDVNNDGTVDIYDAILLAIAFQTKPGQTNWNPDADLNADLVIDIYDAIIVASNYGKKA
jgi:hypothetical protein